MRKLYTAFVLGMFSLPMAHADGLKAGIDPYLGYGLLGSMSTKVGTTSSEIGSMSGIGLGARATLGFAQMFWVGIDGSYSPSQGFAPASGGASSSVDGGTNILRIGAVAGIDVPVAPIRAWLGYNFLNDLSDSSSAAGANVSLNGSSFKIGIGYKPIPMLSINAEYILANFASVSVNGTKTVFPSTTSVTQNMLFLSASVPFQFPF